MHDKLKDTRNQCNSDDQVAQVPGINPAKVRTVALPAGLTADQLSRLPPEDIDRIVKEHGRSVGYEALFKLAGGIGGTPPNTQFLAARFLVERAETLENAGNSPDEVLKKLRGADPAVLRALVQRIEAEQAAALPAIDTEPAPDNA